MYEQKLQKHEEYAPIILDYLQRKLHEIQSILNGLQNSTPEPSENILEKLNNKSSIDEKLEIIDEELDILREESQASSIAFAISYQMEMLHTVN